VYSIFENHFHEHLYLRISKLSTHILASYIYKGFKFVVKLGP